MQISSANTGLYPATRPTTPRTIVPANGSASATTSPAEDTYSSRQIALSTASNNVVLSATLVSDRQRLGMSNEERAYAATTAQRAVAEYTSVASQEHRSELIEILGISVFA